MDQDVEGAKNILAANTTLTEAQINEVVEGVNKDVSEQVEAYQKQVSQAVEAASDYTEAVLWTVFVASAIGLAVSVLGGHLGAETTRRLYPNIQRGSATS